MKTLKIVLMAAELQAYIEHVESALGVGEGQGVAVECASTHTKYLCLFMRVELDRIGSLSLNF